MTCRRGALTVFVVLGLACGGGDASAPVKPLGPSPVVSGITPTHVCPGATFTLVVTGSGFGAESVVRFNGVAHATTVVSATELRAAIVPTDLAAGNATITVANGTTVGVTSATLVVGGSSSMVLTGAPTGAVATGQPSFRLFIDGSDFTPTTVATWGGAPRVTTYVRPTRIVATIDAQDVASAGQFAIGALDTVSYCRSSATLPFSVLPVGAATSSDLKSISTWATGMLWHPGLKRLLIASRSGDLTRGYLHAVDPVTGRSTDSLFIDPEPGRMAMSDDGKYLFIQAQSLDSPQRVMRVQLSPLAVLSQFSVQGRIWDIATVPGSSTSVAVAAIEGASEKIIVYDNGIARPVAQGDGLSITFADANRLYGYLGFSPASIVTNAVTSDGVRASGSVRGDFVGSNTYLEYHAGRLYLSSGFAFDIEKLDSVLGYIGRASTDWDIKSGDGLAVDDRRGRAYEIHNGTLAAWDLNTFQRLGLVKAAPAPPYLPPATLLSYAVRWGTDGLAFNDVGYVHIFRSPLIVP